MWWMQYIDKQNAYGSYDDIKMKGYNIEIIMPSRGFSW